MRKQRSGVYLGPWTTRVLAGLCGAAVLGVATMLGREAPAMVRYLKTRSM